MQLLPLHPARTNNPWGQEGKPVTNEADIIGRKAARHPTPEKTFDLSDDSWRGEHHWRVRRNEGCQQAFSMSNVKRNAMKIRRSKA
jgi:hypothetical protein